MSEIINYTRLTTSDKIADRFLTCQVYIPTDKDQAELGEIFSHVEIKSPWFGSTQVGQTIINTLIREYYRGHDSSELNNFEEAVKKVNESLAKSAQNGETEWIGKLSSVLILINNSEVHFAQTGKSHAYLYRGGRVNHITEGLEQEDAPHPLKTFSNLTSGSLQEGDKIVIANESFFEILNPNELKMIVSALPPTQAAIECAKIIQMQGVSDANATFIELTTKEKLANLSPDQKLEAVYLDHQVMGISTLSKNALFNVGALIKTGFSKMIAAITGIISPIAKKGISKTQEKSKVAIEKTKQITQERIEEIDTKLTEASVNKGEKGFFLKIFGVVTKLFLKIKNKMRRNLIHTGIYSQKKSRMYLIFLLPVIIILIVAVSYGLYEKKNNKSAKELENNHNQIISLEGEASILVSKNDSTTALTKYKEIINLANTLDGTKFSSSAQASSQKAKTKIAELTNLQIIKPQQLVKTENSRSLELASGDIALINRDKIFIKKPADASLPKGADLALKSDEALFSTLIDDSNIALITKNKKLLSFNIKNSQLTQANTEINSTGPICSYSSNIYLLDNAASQIYKIEYDDGSYQAPVQYFKNPTDISKVAGFAIDGSLYTIDTDGLIIKYSRGQETAKINFSLPANEKMKSYLQIKTNESSDYLYIMANDQSTYRLIQIKKSGGFVKQYSLSDVKSPKDMAINESIKELYLLDQDSLLTYKLN